MTAILDAVSSIFTAAIGWVGQVAGVITAQADGAFKYPILLIFCVLPLVGLGVGLFKRLISVN